MLYLAEVQKQRVGLLSGNARTELKLLACQRSDQNWNNVSEEVITAEEASKMNDGSLVLVELNPNRQVQRVQEAGRPLVNILQNFSRQIEKFKLKEEEIDQWKQSLMFQVQELNRREMDMESRWEQLQNLEGELERLETEKEEVKSSRAEISNLQEELERKNQELEGAWDHLRGERQRLEELQVETTQNSVLNEQQSLHIADLLNRLSNDIGSTDTLRENINLVLEAAEQQQATLTPHWEKLESERNLAQQQQGEIEQLSQTVSDRQSQLQGLQNSVRERIAKLEEIKTQLNSKTELSRILEEQSHNQEDLYQKGQTLVAMAGNMVLESHTDVEALNNLPLEELQQRTEELENKLEIDSGFVKDQEQELDFKDEAIKELETKIQQASEEDRKRLEMQLAEELDLYQMLYKSLKPQRNNLIKQEQIFKEHQNILLKRQGHSVNDPATDNIVALKSIISQLDNQKEKNSQQLQQLATEIQQLNAELEQQQGEIDNQTQELESQRQELESIEEQLLNLRTTNAERWGKINLYQEALQPIQDQLDGIKAKVQLVSDSINTEEANASSPQETITEMRQTLQGLVSSVELLAS